MWDTHETFWKIVGGKGNIKAADLGGSDVESFRVEKPLIKLYRYV